MVWQRAKVGNSGMILGIQFKVDQCSLLAAQDRISLMAIGIQRRIGFSEVSYGG
jgi:hypothetical protein